MPETFSWITNDSAERIRKTHAGNHCLTGESSLFQTSFPPPPCATHANSLRETNVASPRPVSRPTHRPLTCTSINLPAHRAPRPLSIWTLIGIESMHTYKYISPSAQSDTPSITSRFIDSCRESPRLSSGHTIQTTQRLRLGPWALLIRNAFVLLGSKPRLIVNA